MDQFSEPVDSVEQIVESISGSAQDIEQSTSMGLGEIKGLAQTYKTELTIAGAALILWYLLK